MQNVYDVEGGVWERPGRVKGGQRRSKYKPYLIGEREARDLGELESMLKSARLLPRLT